MGNTEDDDDDDGVRVTAVLKMVLDSVPREVSEKRIHLTPFTVCLSGPCVTMAILRIQFVGALVDFHKHGDASERVTVSFYYLQTFPKPNI